MLYAPATWPTSCERLTQKRLQRLAGELPRPLARLARLVHDADKGWEWKHFWSENAELWRRQSQMSRALSGQWSERHDAVVDDWNKSEHAATFLQGLNQGLSVARASTATLKVLAQQLEQLAVRHLGVQGQLAAGYQSQFELGEFPTPALSHKIALGPGRELEFFSWDKKHFARQVERIREALGLIKTYSPASYQLFQIFTKRVTPIKQREFVSYSLQTLPGHSFINLYHRDRLDLLDDLLHENGHHHLNHFLILHDPLREDPEPTYYSPWRRTPRPIRGIYHAHLTFFFALKLYHDLARHLLAGRLELPWRLTLTEKQKIFRRYLEEWHMLDYTAQDLAVAHGRGQIKACGWQLFLAMEKERRALGGLVAKAHAQLGQREKKQLKELRHSLRRL